MAVILTPSIIQKAAVKFVSSKRITEQSSQISPPGREAHIYNLYEDLAMPLSDIIEIGRLALQAKVENIQEKMDGQYFGFTVRDGSLRVFTKLNLVTDSQLQSLLNKITSDDIQAGMDLSGIQEKFSSPGMKGVKNAFTVAYEALEPVALLFQDSLFRNGEVIIAAQVLHESSQNTIAYIENSLRFISPISLVPDVIVSSSDLAYQEFLSLASAAGNEAFKMDETPVGKLISDLESDDEAILREEKRLNGLIQEYGLGQDSTVGDFVKAAVIRVISQDHSYIPQEYISAVADRFATGKGRVGIDLKKVLSTEDYTRFRELDKRKRLVVDEAIIPLEEIIQRIGISVIEKLELALDATNRDELLGFVEQAKIAFEEGFDFGLGPDDTDTLEKIRVSLARLESNKELFTIASEGIVFTYKGKTYKLTGLFTPINKLRGFFEYGSASLPTAMTESINRTALRFLKEGGAAFKDQDGNITTRQGAIKRNEVSRILNGFDSEVLSFLGLKYIPVGSTGTDTETVGDIDIAVDIASKEELYNLLVSSLEEDNVKKVGQLIAVKFNVPGSSENDFVQIDIVPSASVEDTAWIMKGGSQGSVKGVFRNLLLSYIARVKTDKETSTLQQIKYSVSFPGGLLVKVDGKQREPREPDPDKFLPILGINVDKSEVDTFEKLVLFMQKSQEFSTILPGFKDYISNSRYLLSDNPKIQRAAQKAVDYIEKNNLSEMILREAIRRIIGEETESDSVSSSPATGEQLLLFTPAHSPPLDAISTSWVKSHGVEDPLYDVSKNKLYKEGIPALLMGYEASSLENEGEMFEDGMIEYAKALGIEGMERIGGEGEDLRLGNRTYESKKSKSSSPTLMFNSTFPKSRDNHFYLFTMNVPSRSQINSAKSYIEQAGLSWEEGLSSLSSQTSAAEDKIKEIDVALARWKTQPIEPEEEGEQQELFESAIIDDQEFKTKKALKAYRSQILKTLKNSSEANKILHGLGANITAVVVSSAVLRVAIMQSAFPGAFEGPDQIFDPTTGQVIQGGERKIVSKIKSYLDDFGLEYKIAEKIAPALIKDLVSGLDDQASFETGWTMNMGLLGVRVKVYMEPKGASRE